LRYRNIKTGAIIDSSFNISGENWELEGPEEPKEVVVEEAEEYIEEEINLEEMTNKQLEEFAKEHGIELSTDDKRNKESRINAIAKAFE